ncbi:Sec-independent protein translocase subunit TatA [Cryptosporangium sp. NPDC051539]|uniref:Sec-independent protein translocase subunit TatA n=1 Tax=Cryptosporangium sp. NPDC051539 TaxID=3363962 RepID=UPI0037A4F911
MGALKPWHIAVLVIVLLLLFGAKRLPDAARGLGRSLRIFKAETEGLMKDDVKGKAEAKHERAPLTEERTDQADQFTERPNPVVESRVVDSRSETRDQR